VRKRVARREAVGDRGPILVEAKPNALCWSLDFVHDQFANGRRFRVLNIVDDVTKECLGTIPDTSISGRRVARELTTIVGRRLRSALGRCCSAPFRQRNLSFSRIVRSLSLAAASSLAARPCGNANSPKACR
jgi:transposase InsO family protein